MNGSKTQEDDLRPALENLADKKIFFGHQSVGYNIIEGIKEIISNEAPGARLNIKETRQLADFSLAVFAHSAIGRNQELASKIDDFKQLMDSGIASKVDIAFFKFCFVDVGENTDIAEIFRHYADSISILEAKYPQVKFLHCTVPLTAIKGGVKARIRQFLKYAPGNEGDNLKRVNFNQMLKEKYRNKVFDLAGIESTYPDGSKAEFSGRNGKSLYLIPAYSNDGGHLNQVGRMIVAKELIKFLSDY